MRAEYATGEKSEAGKLPGRPAPKLEIQGGWLVERGPERPGQFYVKEKRKSRRFRDGQRVACHPAASHSFSALVIDAGLGGLRLRTETVLSRGTTISLVVKFGREITQFHVKVLRTTEKDDTFEYGTAFSGMDMKCSRPLHRYIRHLQSQEQGRGIKWNPVNLLLSWLVPAI